MELNQSCSARATRAYCAVGSLVFVSALVYYFLYRTQLPWPGYLLNLESAPFLHIGDFTKGAYPSFAFTLSIGLIAIGSYKLHKVRASTAVLSVWAVGLLHEVSLGTFTQVDVVAGTVGALIPLVCIFISKQRLETETGNFALVKPSRFNAIERLKLSALIVVSATLATATSEYEPKQRVDCISYDENGVCIASTITASPVFMSYADLRSAVKMSGPRELKSVSRIYLYESMLFVNERNAGIHIIDNRFPSSPERIGFIEIPGNTEINIKDNNLYADSYIDLVTLDLTDIENITEIAREESIFPYDSRQNIPDNVRLAGVIDSERGVVVGYQ